MRINNELQSDYKLKIHINPQRLSEDELRQISKTNPATYLARNNIIGQVLSEHSITNYRAETVKKETENALAAIRATLNDLDKSKSSYRD